MEQRQQRPARRPTLADVAAVAGVSPKSVSRVVNGEPHVSDAVVARVQQAVAELGYRPDGRARELAGGTPRGGLIGFVQVDAANPFFALVSRGLEDVVRDRGMTVVTGSTDADPQREAALVRTFVELRVRGLVVAAAEGDDALLRSELARGTAAVCVDRVVDGAEVDVVVSENRRPTAAAVAHLVALGHRRIGFLGGNQAIWTATERLAGFTEAMTAAGLAIDPALVVIDVDAVDRSRAATRRLLDAGDPPTALVTAQDRITTGAVVALHALGRQRDVALVGFDAIPFAAELVPSVTTIEQDPYRMGTVAGELLLERLAGAGGSSTGRRIELPAPLVHRASGSIGPPPTP